MSTNFYYLKDELQATKMSPFVNLYLYENNILAEDGEIHIGKLSGLGYFCKECHVRAKTRTVNDEMKSTCPLCHKEIKETGMCFTWRDQDRDRYLLSKLKDCPDLLIVDEYGNKYTVKSFLEVIDECDVFKSCDFDFC